MFHRLLRVRVRERSASIVAHVVRDAPRGVAQIDRNILRHVIGELTVECNNTKHGISTLYASGSNARGFPFVDLVGVGTTPNFWGFTPSARATFFFCRRINWFSLRFASI